MSSKLEGNGKLLTAWLPLMAGGFNHMCYSYFLKSFVLIGGGGSEVFPVAKSHPCKDFNSILFVKHNHGNS